MIFLDFDGVLYNTVKEAYAVAMITNNNVTNLSEIDFSSKHYRDFLENRYLIGPAWNYKYLLQALSNHGLKNIESEYNHLLLAATKNEYVQFEKMFFNTRLSLQKQDFEKWLLLNEPYDFLTTLKNYLIRFPEKFIIITTKDKKTVLKLLKMHNIDFAVTRIFDKEDFDQVGNKGEIIQNIMDTQKITHAVFVDDSAKHLEQCKNIENLELCQASWGYISPKDTKTVSEKIVFDKIKKIIGF